MQRIRLNLTGLRSGELPETPDLGPTLTHLLDAQGYLAVSRREFLGLAGMAAATVPSVAKGLGPALLGRVEFGLSSRRVVVRLAGRDRWVIDPRQFGGAARLRILRGEGRLRVELTNARYPGTALPADMVCDFKKVLAGWRLKVKMALGGTSREMPLESFLAGAEPVRTRLKIAETSWQLSPTVRVSIGGTARGELLPNWTLRLEGKDLAALRGLGRDLISDTATLSLLDPSRPSLMQKPLRRRTLIVLSRGKHEWEVDLAPDDPDHGRVIARGRPFETIEIETGEGPSSSARGAFVARGEEEGNGLVYQPAGGLLGEDGRRFELGLRNVRYAVAFDDGGDHAVLLADFCREPVWLHANGCSMRLGHAEDISAFEVHSRNGRIQRLRCEPGLLAFAAPLPDAIVEATPTAEGTRLAFVAEGTRLAQGTTPTLKRLPTIIKPLPKTTEQKTKPAATGQTGAGGAAIQVKPRVIEPRIIKPPAGQIQVKPGIVGVLSLNAPPVTVIRPDDLLNLTFEFDNLQLKAEGGATKLVRQKRGSPAHIIVKFPPQNIAERAFWESATAAHPAPPAPADRPNPTGNETPTAPAMAVMSQPSRLVFALPNNVDSIDYSLEALLDWGKYTPAVSPAALPPPPPPKVVRPITGIRVAPSRAAPAQPKAPTITPRLPGIPHFTGENITMPAVEAQLPTIAKPGARRPAAGVAATKSPPAILVPVRPGMVIRGPQLPSEPGPTTTAIEAPYRLILSPHAGVGWVHSLDPVSTVPEENAPNRFELWHTRMGVRLQDGTVDEEDDWYRTLRAIWTPDYRLMRNQPTLPGKPNEDQLHNHPTWPSKNTDGFRMSLSRDDRVQIVWLTGDPTIRKDFQERVVRAKNFMLSALGAWIDTRYDYDLDEKGLKKGDTHGTSLDLVEWVHKAAMGRDSYVRVVYAGYLFPFGHKAALIKITERKVVSSTYGPLACLRQRAYIAVREPVKTYRNTGLRDTRSNPASLVDRQMPFTSVEITSLVTPALDAPSSVVHGAGGAVDHAFDWYCFWANVGGRGFPFHVRATDTDGKTVGFKAPMIFISRATPTGKGVGAYQNLNVLLKVKDAYDNRSGNNKTAQLNGQKLALADPAELGDTRLECQSLTWTAYVYERVPPEGTPAFTPTLDQAGVRIPAAAALMKTSNVPLVRLAGPYIQDAENVGKVFAELVHVSKFEFPGDKAGGLCTPDLSITGLSGKLGPIGGAIDTFAGGTFDPMEYFKNALPKLLGTISLADVVDKLVGKAFDAVKIPGLTHKVEQENGIPTGILVEFKWEPGIHPWPSADQPFLGITKPIFDHLDPAPQGKHVSLFVHAKVHASFKKGGDSSALVEARMANFALNLLPLGGYDYFVRVTFNELKFSASDTQKPDVSCDLGDLKFGGPLSFIEELRNYIPLDGFKDPPYLNVDTSGVKLGYTLEIPTIGVGVFTLSNLSLAAGVNIPFLGSGVTLRFEFCKKESPFALAYTIFGGGGHFACELGIDGLKLIEASFEFGGTFAFDIGVASGGAHIMAGIYFKLTQNAVELEGYVRLGGNLSILGLVRVSLEFYLSLKYVNDSGGSSVWGRASLDVEIDIVFFSFSVSVSVERRFAGSGGSSSAWLPDGTRLAMLTDSPEGYAQLPRLPGGGAAKPRGGGRPSLGGGGETPQKAQDFISADQWKVYCAAFG